MEEEPTAPAGGRIAANIPITLNGGIITLIGAETGNVTETIGPVTLGSGESYLQVGPAGWTSSTTLQLTTVNRAPGATLHFQNGGPDPNHQLRFLTPPTLVNGIIGGWTLVEAQDRYFAT